MSSNLTNEPKEEREQSTSVNQESLPDCFYLEIPIYIQHTIGLNPANLSEARLRTMRAIHCLFLCEGLFWSVQQLGMMIEHGGWVYDSTTLSDSLSYIGEIGKAIASSATEDVEMLERLAEKRQGEQVSDGD